MALNLKILAYTVRALALLCLNSWVGRSDRKESVPNGAFVALPSNHRTDLRSSTLVNADAEHAVWTLPGLQVACGQASG